MVEYNRVMNCVYVAKEYWDDTVETLVSVHIFYHIKYYRGDFPC